jgi:C4-dicarboxylate-binding protein DctP
MEEIMHNFRNSLYGIALVGAMLVSAPVLAATDIIISSETSAKSLKGQTFILLEKELNSRLGSKAKVALHHSGTLFTQKTQIQGLQLGSVHIISPTAGHYSRVAKKIGALLLPFLLSSPEAIDEAMKDKLVQTIFMPDLSAKNIVPIAVWMNGARSFGHKGREPALTPDKWKGIKIRVQSAPIFIKTIQAIKANVIGMSWSEVPTALQQGVIDAAEPTPNAWKSSSIYKFVDHIILNEYIYSFYIVGANKQWWEGMPKDEKAGVQGALDAATKWNWKEVAKKNNAAVDFIRKAGTKVHKLTTAQKKQWQKAVAPVWKTLGEDMIGSKVMNRLKEISAKHIK